jgi:hypothetical protein
MLGDSMASHFSTIGLPVASAEDMNALANRVGSLAEPLSVPGGVYFRRSDSSSAEIWLQVNANNEVIGMNTHYAGQSAVRVGLTARLPSAGPSELDGSFHAPDTGCYPLVFDAPDYRLHEELPLPTQKEVQIAAFAQEVAAFETVAAYEANLTGDLKLASQSFIPTGLFTPAGDSHVPPQARAIFAGHVLAADKKINVLTGRAFYWALVHAYGGAYDVVIDSNLLPGVPEVGGVIPVHSGYPAGSLRGIRGDYRRTTRGPEAESLAWLDFRSLGLTGRALPGRSSSKMTRRRRPIGRHLGLTRGAR